VPPCPRAAARHWTQRNRRSARAGRVATRRTLAPTHRCPTAEKLGLATHVSSDSAPGKWEPQPTLGSRRRQLGAATHAACSHRQDGSQSPRRAAPISSKERAKCAARTEIERPDWSKARSDVHPALTLPQMASKHGRSGQHRGTRPVKASVHPPLTAPLRTCTEGSQFSPPPLDSVGTAGHAAHR